MSPLGSKGSGQLYLGLAEVFVLQTWNGRWDLDILLSSEKYES